MVLHIELSAEEGALMRTILDERLLELRKEINRTDSLAFKDTLRETQRALERLIEQLPPPAPDVGAD